MADSFNKKAAFDIGDLENQRVVLTNNVQLYFEAQKLDFDIKSDSKDIKQNMVLLGQVAEQTKFLATTVVRLIGYLDTAKAADFKAQGNQAFIEASAQAKLISKKRAEFVEVGTGRPVPYRSDQDRHRGQGLGQSYRRQGSFQEPPRRSQVHLLRVRLAMKKAPILLSATIALLALASCAPSAPKLDMGIFQGTDGYVLQFGKDFKAGMNSVDDVGISVAIILDVSGSMSNRPAREASPSTFRHPRP